MPDNMYPYRKNCPPPKLPKEKVKMNKYKKATIGYGSLFVLGIVALLVATYAILGMHVFVVCIGFYITIAFVFGMLYVLSKLTDNYNDYKRTKH